MIIPEIDICFVDCELTMNIVNICKFYFNQSFTEYFSYNNCSKTIYCILQHQSSEKTIILNCLLILSLHVFILNYVDCKLMYRIGIYANTIQVSKWLTVSVHNIVSVWQYLLIYWIRKMRLSAVLYVVVWIGTCSIMEKMIIVSDKNRERQIHPDAYFYKQVTPTHHLNLLQCKVLYTSMLFIRIDRTR